MLTKVDGTGGEVNLRTVKEQMLYEVHDPANYLTPDVVVDFTTAKLQQVGPNRVRVSGIKLSNTGSGTKVVRLVQVESLQPCTGNQPSWKPNRYWPTMM